ncbi:hypothetical protein OH76DRAFT_1562135 [Lentinus brumalis]|uniref:F-box domain-containing protein n=1 Tax=Lentinus brumalis TaxID=2498619 RepID=A0A371CJG1_9APHY|nr:hypothetical protein OH76DRAFT_1562135 [Polyporus brumalis]
MTTTVPAILTQQDVLDEVFSHLTPEWIEVVSPAWDEDPDPDTEDPDYDPSAEADRKLLRSTLATAALVCRIFSEKALAALWRVLDNIVPLLRLLPGTRSLSNIRIYRDISDTTWSKFQSYARRVRKLNSLEPSVPIHPSTWHILVQRLAGAPLLPRLRCLKVAIMPPQVLQGVLLLSPTLQRIVLSTPSDGDEPDTDPETGVFVDNLVRHIFLLSVPADVRRAIQSAAPDASHHVQSLGRFTAVQDLDLFFAPVRIGYETLQALSCLESLRTLHAYVSLGTMPSSASFRDGFPVLVALSLRGSLEDSLKLLQALPPEKLTELELCTETSVTDTVEDYKRFLASVRPLISLSLEYLCLSPSRLEPHSALSLADIIRPMLPLRELSSFKCKLGVYPSDGDLRAFATAWPRLTNFSATHYDDMPDLEPVTVPGLIDLLQRCPHLESIELATLDVAHLPSPSAVPRLENRVRELEIDQFVGEAEADLLAFALIIDRLLPCLNVPRSITAATQETRWTDKLWDRVRLLVAPLQAARRYDTATT